MLRQIQPNNWSCLLTAFSNVTHIPIETFYKHIGHDGSLLLNIAEPTSYVGFHIQEIIETILPHFAVTEILEAVFDNGYMPMRLLHPVEQRILHWMSQFDGVLCINICDDYDHALAWDHNTCILFNSSTGKEQPLSDVIDDLAIFWAVTKLEG